MPDALAEMYDKASLTEVFRDHEPPVVSGLRPYQLAAIESTEHALRKGKRAILVAMATGTGKTFVTVSQIYRLLRVGAAKRILFLVDRRALAAQAVRQFSSFTTPGQLKFNQEYEVYSQQFQRGDFGDDDPFDPKVLPEAYLRDPQPAHTFVYVSTIQRMAINLLGAQYGFQQDSGDPDYEPDVHKIDIPIHAFDVIIADECHRGYTAS